MEFGFDVSSMAIFATLKDCRSFCLLSLLIFLFQKFLKMKLKIACKRQFRKSLLYLVMYVL